MEWISVKDQTPPEGKELVFKIKEGLYYKPALMCLGKWAQEGEWTPVYVNNGQDCSVTLEDITHWMPLPEPPK